MLWLFVWLLKTISETTSNTTRPEREVVLRTVKDGLRVQDAGASVCRKLVDLILKMEAICLIRTGCHPVVSHFQGQFNGQNELHQ